MCPRRETYISILVENLSWDTYLEQICENYHHIVTAMHLYNLQIRNEAYRMDTFTSAGIAFELTGRLPLVRCSCLK